MSLDHVAARMVMQARQFERALHDPGPWSITVGAVHTVLARKVVGEDHVTFIAVLPLNGDCLLAELRSGLDLVAVKFLDPVGGYAEVRWTFEVSEAAVAA